MGWGGTGGAFKVSSGAFKVSSSRQLLLFCFVVSALLSWIFALGRGFFLFGFAFVCLVFFLCLRDCTQWFWAAWGQIPQVPACLLGREQVAPLHQASPVYQAPSWGESTTSRPGAASLPWLLLSLATRKAKFLCELWPLDRENASQCWGGELSRAVGEDWQPLSSVFRTACSAAEHHGGGAPLMFWIFVCSWDSVKIISFVLFASDYLLILDCCCPTC